MPFLDEARVIAEKPTEAYWAVKEALNSFFESVDVGMLEIPKRDALSGSGRPSLSLKIEKQFLVLSEDPNRKKTVMFTVPVDTKILSGPVDVSKYFRSFGNRRGPSEDEQGSQAKPLQ